MATYKTGTFSVIGSDGKNKRIYVRGKDSTDLAKKLAVKQYEYERGLITLNNNTSLSVWVEKWLETYKKGSVGTSHYNQTKQIVQKTFVEQLGAMPISDIKTIHLQKCLNALQGQSISKIRKASGSIKDVFNKAAINEMIDRNPALGLVLPSGTVGHRRALTPAEQNVFMKAVDKHPRGPFFALILACGLRPGEARALTWFNVDMKKKSLTVTQAIEHGTKNKTKDPKSAAGKRTVPIPDWYMVILEQIEHTDGCPYVFHNSKNEPITTTKYKEAWSSFFRMMDIAAGAKLYRNQVIAHAIDTNITPYYLRHTYATQLAEKGVDIKTAQYLLGHSDIKMTLQIYTHVSDKMLEDARRKINSKSGSGGTGVAKGK